MIPSSPITDPTELKDRIIGSVLGVFIGDALGVGVHWQYDLDTLRADRGFVTGYLDPRPGSFHSATPDAPGRGKLTAGQLEQQGAIDRLLLESLAEHKALNQSDFLDRLETNILRDPSMDGTRQGGRHGWTDKSICDLFQCRIVHKKPWPDCASPRSDTPDAIVRASLLAGRYFATPHEMAIQVNIHARAATLDSSVQAHAVAFASMIAAAIQGVPLDESMKEFLYQQPGRSLPYSSMLATKDFDPVYGAFTEPDSLLWFGSIARGLKGLGRPSSLHIEVCSFMVSFAPFSPQSHPHTTVRLDSQIVLKLLSCALSMAGVRPQCVPVSWAHSWERTSDWLEFPVGFWKD